MPTQITKLSTVNADSASLPVLMPTEFEHSLYTNLSLKKWYAARDGVLADKWLCRKTDTPLVKTATMPTQTTSNPKLLNFASVDNALKANSVYPVDSSFTLIFVGKKGPGDNAYLCSAGRGVVSTNNDIMYLQHSSNGSITFGKGTTKITSLASYNTGLCLIVARYDAANQKIMLRVNNSQISDTSTTANTLNSADFIVGGLEDASGTIGGGIDGGQVGEIMIFDKLLTGEDVLSIESYLSSKYGI